MVFAALTVAWLVGYVAVIELAAPQRRTTYLPAVQWIAAPEQPHWFTR